MQYYFLVTAKWVSLAQLLAGMPWCMWWAKLPNAMGMKGLRRKNAAQRTAAGIKIHIREQYRKGFTASLFPHHAVVSVCISLLPAGFGVHLL
jgi:hypothetical protein